ncbi:MAG: sulfotransferase [Halioglobus sp.]|nr:sulfotransferase [Halioglobus sp.]
MTIDEDAIAKEHAAAKKAMHQGLLREAHQHCLAILQRDQTFADAWFLCGVIAAHNGQLAKAAEILRNAISLAPDNPEYRAELGKQLIVSHQPEWALREAEAALSLNPVQLPTLNTLGTVFSHVGEHGKALQCFKRAEHLLEERVGGARALPLEWQADFYFNTGASMQFAGNFTAAEHAYEKAIALQPLLFKAHTALSTVRQQTSTNNHLNRLYELRSEISSSRDQLHLGHAIAKEQEDLGDYEDAYANLTWAKQAQSAEGSYSAESDQKFFAGVQKLFDQQVFETPRTSCDNREPIFIVGMPRTGTTLVEQILSSHSQVYSAGELQNLPLQVNRLTGSSSDNAFDLEALEQSLLHDYSVLGSDYIDSTRPRTGHTQYFIDKLPLNFVFLGLIKLALPNAKLVCLRRDPMDTCLSNYRQMFGVNFKHYRYNLNLLDCGRYYIQFDQVMEHWRKVMPGAVHEVEYEALVGDPERVSRDLLAYCNLPWEEACLSFHQRKTSVATPSAVQVRQGIYTTSVNRWQLYGDAMDPLYELLKSAGFYF